MSGTVVYYPLNYHKKQNPVTTQTDFIDKLKELYENHFHEQPEETEVLPVSGSDRRYVRFHTKNNRTVLGAYNPDKNENNTFFYFTRIFEKNELPVPEIIEISQDKQHYLLEDLGSLSLFEVIEQEGHSERVKMLFKKSIDQLVRFHWQGGRAIDYSMCFSAQTFDRKQIFSDLLYFKYYFVDLVKVPYNKPELLEELESWSKNLAGIRPQTFMYRDFQSRNIQVVDDEVYFIDYQGGMLGLAEYDLASLLWQARAQLPEEWKNELVNYYFKAVENLAENPNIRETEFRKTYLECVLLRIMQTLGAYGFRGLMERKVHFLKSIEPALQQLAAYLNEYPHYPVHNELRKVLDSLVKPAVIQRFSKKVLSSEEAKALHVDVYSFSFKKGLPADDSEHGGGYVFDCRGIQNPGRIDAYKNLTGKEEPVIDFLESKTKMPAFMEHVFGTVDISVEDYLARGFDRLSVSFGCTGGQHRSVYAAEAMAAHLIEKYGVSVQVRHLEQDGKAFKRR
jgi:aminoglycoside/choline kinase family phosphotransferase